jgi:mono/diheme cytochrome c family protein
MNAKYFVIGFFALAGLMYLYQGLFPHRMEVADQDPHSVQSTVGETGAPLVEVVVPELSAAAQAGKDAFDVNCAACHGTNAAGQDGVAPPLVHIIYEPNHHSDQSFYQAVGYGVRAHHWRFGNMPPIEGVSQSEVGDIIAYVRELQRANGIF